MKNCIDGNASSYFLVQPQADPTSITIDLGALIKVPPWRTGDSMRFTKLQWPNPRKKFWAIFWYVLYIDIMIMNDNDIYIYILYVYLKRPFPSNLWEESRKPVFGRVIYRQPGFLVENRVLWLQPFFQPLFFPPRWSNGPLVCSLAISKLLEGVGGVASGKWVNSKHVRS